MAGGGKSKIFVVVKSKVTPMDKTAKAGAKGDVLKKLTLISNKAAARGLPNKFSTKENDKPKKNSRLYDAIILIPKVKLTTQTKGSNVRVTANVGFEIGALKVSKKQTFMIHTNISGRGAAEGGGKIELLAGDVIYAVVEDVTRKTMKDPRLKPRLKEKGFNW